MRLLALICTVGGLVAQPTVTDEQVRRVHRQALLIDSHNDVTSDTVKGLDIGRPRQAGHTDTGRLRQGGVGAVFFAAYVAASYARENRSAHRALEMIDTIRHDIIGAHPGDYELALTAADVERVHKAGKIAALIGIEGGHAIEDSPRLLRQFYSLGVRYMTLTHANSNGWADSSGDRNKPHNGISALGRTIIAEMNRLGIIVDISHVSDAAFHAALQASRAPIFASHSSCRALSNIARNMSDDMIRALAGKGGVIQVNLGCEFLSQKSAATSNWTNSAYPKDKPIQPASLADVVAHIDHVVKIAGIDAVGIGSDFDGISCVPVGLEDVSKFPNLTRALLEKGYRAGDIQKIYGGNLLRLMRAVEAARK